MNEWRFDMAERPPFVYGARGATVSVTVRRVSSPLGYMPRDNCATDLPFPKIPTRAPGYPRGPAVGGGFLKLGAASQPQKPCKRG
jgi:hypothetical protein